MQDIIYDSNEYFLQPTQSQSWYIGLNLGQDAQLCPRCHNNIALRTVYIVELHFMLLNL